jgi:hypothetical protein
MKSRRRAVQATWQDVAPALDTLRDLVLRADSGGRAPLP